jgi:hypothetical protein
MPSIKSNYPSFPNEMMLSNKFSTFVDGVRLKSTPKEVNTTPHINTDKNTINDQKERLATGHIPNFKS